MHIFSIKFDFDLCFEMSRCSCIFLSFTVVSLWANQDEDEVDQGTMVRASTSDLGTVRAAGSLRSSLGTMIEHNDSTLDSQLGTMVINSEDEQEDAGTMKRE